MNVAVILNFNDYKMTIDFVNEILNYKCIDKIIVVDNCSTDSSYEKFNILNGIKVDIIKTNNNNGYACGNNFGIKYAELNYTDISNFIITNPDIHITEGALSELLNFLNSKEDAAAVSGIEHNINNQVVRKFAWKLPTYLDTLCETSVLLNKFYIEICKKGIYYDSNILKNIMNSVDVLPGNFFIIKSSVIQEVGYFDERTFLYGEENILSYKIKKANYKNYILCNENYQHYEGYTIQKNINEWKVKAEFNRQCRYLYLKYYLKTSKFKLVIFNIFFFIGKYETYIINHLTNRKKKYGDR